MKRLTGSDARMTLAQGGVRRRHRLGSVLQDELPSGESIRLTLVGGCSHGAKEAVQPSNECNHGLGVGTKGHAFEVNGLTHRLTGLILEVQEGMHYRL